MEYKLDAKNKSALIQAEVCDTERLAQLCEEMIQKEGVELCVAYGEDSSGCKFTVRSISNIIRADEIAEYLAESMGAGGGQAQKAGGFLSRCLFQEEKKEKPYGNYFKERLEKYFSEYDIIHVEKYQFKKNQMKRYRKKKIKLAVARTIDFLKEGTPVLIRTLEGDMECVSAKDLYIMIGIDGEVYPIRQEKFDHSYEFTQGEPECVTEYEPTIHNTITGESYILTPFLKTCQNKGISYIYAKPLEKPVKIFTQWDEEKYLKGVKGDYLAVRDDDFCDIYIIEKSVFLRSYERCR